MQLLRTDYSGKGLWQPIADAFNKIGRAVNAIQGENGIEVYEVGGVMRISGTGNSRSRAPFPFEVYVRSGEVFMRGGPAMSTGVNSFQSVEMIGSYPRTLKGGTPDPVFSVGSTGGLVWIRYRHANPYAPVGTKEPGQFYPFPEYTPGTLSPGASETAPYDLDTYWSVCVPIARVSVVDGNTVVTQYASGTLFVSDAMRGSVMLWPVEVTQPPRFWVPMDGRPVPNWMAGTGIYHLMPDWKCRVPVQSNPLGTGAVTPKIEHGEKGGRFGLQVKEIPHMHYLEQSSSYELQITTTGQRVAPENQTGQPVGDGFAILESVGSLYRPKMPGYEEIPGQGYDIRDPYVGVQYVMRI